MPRRGRCDTRSRAGARRAPPSTQADENQTSLRLRSTSTDGAIAYLGAAYPQATHKARRPRVLERIEWLAMFCNLQPRAKQVLLWLARRDEWTPLGKLVDALPA